MSAPKSNLTDIETATNCRLRAGTSRLQVDMAKTVDKAKAWLPGTPAGSFKAAENAALGVSSIFQGVGFA